MKEIKLLCLILCIIYSLEGFSKEGPITFLEIAYSKQNFRADETYSSQGLTGDLRMAIPFFSQNNFLISFGGAYTSFSGNLNASDTYQLTTLKPYLGIEYFNRSKVGFQLGIFYSPVSLSYFQNSNQTEQETWSGSGYFTRLAFAGKISNSSGFLMGFRYDVGTNSTKSSNSFTSANQLSQALISPFLGYFREW